MESSSVTVRSKKKMYTVILLASVVVIALASGLFLAKQNYDKRYSEVTTQLSKSKKTHEALNKEKKTLTTQNGELKTEIAKYKSENEQLNTTIKKISAENNVVAVPTLSILESKHFNAVPSPLDGRLMQIIIDGVNVFYIIKAEVVNNTNKDVYFSTSDLKLKDSNNVVHPYYTQASVGGWSGTSSGAGFLPSGYTAITSQALKPGERVSGGIIFVGPKSEKTATLYYGDKTYDLQF